MDTEIYAYDDKIKQIDHIDFAIFGNEEIRSNSALGRDSAGIDIPDLYDNMEPKRNGLIDPRLGVTDNHFDCNLCGYNATSCIGHFGHINLAEPMFHRGFLDIVQKILSCICLRCSKPLVYKNERELADMLKNKTGKARLSEFRNIVKNVTHCQKQNYGCGTPVSKIKKEIKTGVISLISEINLANLPTEEGAPAGNQFDGKKKIRQILTPENCYDILRNISDADCLMLGMDPTKSRPEMMIHKVFPVPPVAVRPSTRADFMAS